MLELDIETWPRIGAKTHGSDFIHFTFVNVKTFRLWHFSIDFARVAALIIIEAENLVCLE
jgi:hypothetical protein